MKDKEEITIAELMAMGNSVTIEPDGSVKKKDPVQLADEQQAALDLIPVKRSPSYY